MMSRNYTSTAVAEPDAIMQNASAGIFSVDRLPLAVED